ncbi:MAG: RnfABCDGE type electron transport complex subunit D, partial [Candidatus Margulisbacteria bacterium]|nr:RnfABCDGE type electron transport complex subunit D [Candidatus Margulisiibacteriota bacterium]
IITAVMTEILCKALRRKKATIHDGSAIVTGLLLAMVVPPTLPFWMIALGSFISIAIAKEAFGGLGFNIFNPALVGRAFLLASYPVMMTTWQLPFQTATGATPLGILKEGLTESLPTIKQLFLGNIGGSLGETSALALLIGAGYLLYRKVIDWRIPVSYIGSVALLSFIFGQDPLFHILAGGLILGAFFMATDYVTSPMTPKGKLIFGVGAGVLVVVIRIWGGYPEGVCYSILLMNSVTPLLDKIKR